MGGEQDTGFSGLCGTQSVDFILRCQDREVALIKTDLLNKPGNLIQPGDAEQGCYVFMLLRPQKLLDEVDQRRGLPDTSIKTGEEEAGRGCPISHSCHRRDEFP